MEQRKGSGWLTIWEGPLVNEVAPVSALVANDGAHVVTFDNWHSLGHGEHVVVIYRGDGSVVRSFKLTDILPKDYVRVLPQSVSSLWWSGKHALSADERTLVLKVVAPSAGALPHKPRSFVDVTIDLATGTVAPLTGAAWERAVATAAPMVARDKAAEARGRAATIAPLAAPQSGKASDWHRYLFQAARRLASERRDALFGSTWVLPAPGSSDHAAQAAEIRSALVEADDDRSFASPASPEALARVLLDGAGAVRPGSLTGARLFVALPPAATRGVREALAVTGATVIIFDPAVPIPQRSEKLRELGVTADEAEAAAGAELAKAQKLDADAAALDKNAPRQAAETPRDENASEEMVDDLGDLADKLEAEATATAAAVPR